MIGSHIYEAGKSFWVYANSKEKGCFGCGYCVLLSVDHLVENGDNFKDLTIGLAPGQIDHRLSEIPVAVNNAYGDPLLQWENTKEKLEKLQEYHHTGIVALITKGVLTEARISELQHYSALNLVVFQSISGLDEPLEYQNYQSRIHNIRLLSQANIPLIVYLRPIIPGFNDSFNIIGKILEDVSRAGARIVSYAGLMGRKEIIAQIEKVTKKALPPPTGYTRWQEDKKLVRQDLISFLENEAKALGLEIYRKTSCAASMATGKPYDYNLHMYRPDKYLCCECKNTTACEQAKNVCDPKKIATTLDILKTTGSVQINEGETTCPLIQACTHSLPTCTTTEKYRLMLDGQHTLGEIALARWISGLPTAAENLIDTTEIPNHWEK